MADVKISALPPATTIAAADELAVVQGGTTKKVAFSVLSNTINNAVPVTLTQLDALIAGSTLVPGTTYKISGFNKNMPSGGPGNLNGYLPEVLYDDGTNSGITIYMQALTTTKLATSGYGEFYNPKYYNQSTYNSFGLDGQYGIWDADNPFGLGPSSYNIGDVQFWGGYAWENLTGNTGFDVDTYTLNALDWDKLPYSNTTWYELVIDEIKVDWGNKIIVERFNVENQIRVNYTPDQYQEWLGYGVTNDYYSPISAMGWGNYSKLTPQGLGTDISGLSNLEVINSVMETVNFKGKYCLNSYLKDSLWYGNYIGRDCGFEMWNLTQYSGFYTNVVSDNCFCGYSNLTNGGSIYNLSMQNQSTVSDNNLSDFCYIGILDMLNFAEVRGNVLQQGSYIDTCNLNNTGRIVDNKLEFGAYFRNSFLNPNGVFNNNYIRNSDLQSIDFSNGLSGGSFSENSIINTPITSFNLYGDFSKNYMQDSSINNITINVACSVTNNILTQGSLFNNWTIGSGSYSNIFIEKNQLINSEFGIGFAVSASLVSVQNNTIKSSRVNVDVGSATHILALYSKEIFDNDAGTPRLSYFDSSDVLTVVNVNS